MLYGSINDGSTLLPNARLLYRYKQQDQVVAQLAVSKSVGILPIRNTNLGHGQADPISTELQTM